MSDNLKLTISINDVKELLETIEINTTEYCALYTTEPSDTIIITNNDGFKLLLLKNYDAKEISDWDFNDCYLKDNNHKNYTVIGNDTFVNKGY